MSMRRREFLSLCGTLAGALRFASFTWAQDMTKIAPGDPRADPAYLDRRIRHITDADLFAALDLSRPGLQAVAREGQEKNFPAAYQAWAAYWRSAAPGRELFTGDGDFLCRRDQAAAYFRPAKQQVLADAEKLLRHDIRGWGPVEIQHGPVVDFNADYGKSGKYGFHYWAWARPLVQAYLVTGDEKYLAGFDQLFNQWYEQRDQVTGGWPGLDVIYYELGLGVRNRLFLEDYFLPFSQRTPRTHERMLKTLLGAARWLFDEEALGYRAHNWQIIGSYGLAQIGLMLPEFRESASWVKLGTQRMLEHLAHDFFPDGCHSERCPSSYMTIAYRDPRNLARMLSADRGNAALAEQIRRPLARSLDFWMGIFPPDGVLPGINDGSRSILPGPILQDGTDLFGREDALWIKQHLLDARGVVAATSRPGDPAEHAASTAPSTEPKRMSVQFPASGFTAMRSDWTNEARYLLINHGPTGGGHSHADALSFELNAFGRALAIDAGIGQTYDDPVHESWYVHSVAHNMLTVDAQDCDRAAAEGKDVRWTSNGQHDYFAATHHGYEASKGIIHRRQIVFVKPHYFFIYDVVDSSAGGSAHTLEWNLHLTTPADAAQGPGLIVIPAAAERSNAQAAVSPGNAPAAEPAPAASSSIPETPPAGWDRKMSTGWASVLGISGFEGKSEAQINWLRFTTSIQPVQRRELGVLLFPFAGARPVVRLSSAAGAGPERVFTITHAAGADRIAFKESGIELTSNGT